MKKRKQYDDDDGKVIAKMNVDGMPWYVERQTPLSPEPEGEPYEMNWKEKLSFLWGAVSASLLVALVFGVVFAAVIVFLILFGK